MAWNHPTSTDTQRPKSRKSNARGIVAVTLLVGAVSIAALYFFLSPDENANQQARSSKLARIQSKQATRQSAKENARPVKAETNVSKPKKMDVFKGPEETPITKKKAVDLSKVNYTIHRDYSSGAEQLISWVFNAEVGEMPMILPPIAEEEKKNIVGILMSKMKVPENESEEKAARRETVEYAKKEMMKYIKEGGDPDEFLKYYHNELHRAFEWRTEALNQLETLFYEDREMSFKFAEKINEKFEAEGIKKVDPRIFMNDDEIEAFDAQEAQKKLEKQDAAE